MSTADYTNVVLAALRVLDQQWSKGTANSGFDKETLRLLGRDLSTPVTACVHESVPEFIADHIRDGKLHLVYTRELKQ